jgi:TetR/AcrR family transcriptional repressor of nem operon
MTAKTEQKKRSHDAILESASALLRERGIEASSVGDVMKGAGLTVGGFYNHFASKEALFAETIRAGAGKNWKRLVDGARGATPRERALSVVRGYLGRKHRDDVAGGCLLPNTAPEAARAGEPYRSALESQLEGFVESLAEVLGSGKENREEAIALIALMYGALSLSRAVADTPLSDELLRAARKLGERALDGDAS